MQRKVEYKAGQVVAYRTCAGTRWVQIRTKPDFDGNFLINGHVDAWAHIREIRPLTKRELGERL